MGRQRPCTRHPLWHAGQHARAGPPGRRPGHTRTDVSRRQPQRRPALRPGGAGLPRGPGAPSPTAASSGLTGHAEPHRRQPPLGAHPGHERRPGPRPPVQQHTGPAPGGTAQTVPRQCHVSPGDRALPAGPRTPLCTRPGCRPRPGCRVPSGSRTRLRQHLPGGEGLVAAGRHRHCKCARLARPESGGKTPGSEGRAGQGRAGSRPLPAQAAWKALPVALTGGRRPPRGSTRWREAPPPAHTPCVGG